MNGQINHFISEKRGRHHSETHPNFLQEKRLTRRGGNEQKNTLSDKVRQDENNEIFWRKKEDVRSGIFTYEGRKQGQFQFEYVP